MLTYKIGIRDGVSLSRCLNMYAGADSLYMPQQLYAVKFLKTRKGDKTFITQYCMLLFDDKSDCRQQIMALNVGCGVVILDYDDEWFTNRSTNFTNCTNRRLRESIYSGEQLGRWPYR